jgi:hypothetical protein
MNAMQACRRAKFFAEAGSSHCLSQAQAMIESWPFILTSSDLISNHLLDIDGWE